MSTNEEIVNARFSQATLSAFLGIGHETTGKLKPTDEMIAARFSPVYPFPDPVPTTYLLKNRIDKPDWEIWYGREGQTDLRSLHAFRAPGIKNQILEGSKDIYGYPTWMGNTGANVQIDGSVTPVWFSIDGKLARVRTLKTLTLSGSSGTRYIYAQYLADGDVGKIVVDGDATTPPPAAAVGTTSLDISSQAVYFNDKTRDFTALDVKAGDILTLLDLSDAGTYIIYEVAPGSTISQLQIIGMFPVGGITPINYLIYDPLAVSLGFDTAEVAAAGKLYIGEADFDGVAVTAIRPRHFTDTFIGAWTAVDVTAGTPDLGTNIPGEYELKYDHNLGSDILDISVQVSTSDTGAAPVEEMCILSITNGLNVSITDSIAFSKTDNLTFSQATHATDSLAPNTPQVFTQGSFYGGGLGGTITYTKSGSVTGSLSGDIEIDNGVRVKWSKNSIWIKNAVSNKFFTDYSGTANTTGFIRVIVRKRG
jgi:hypothetical protein